MSMKLEAELIVLRETIRRLLDYKEPENQSILNEIYILEERIVKIKNELGIKKKEVSFLDFEGKR